MSALKKTVKKGLNFQKALCITCNSEYLLETTLKKDIKVDVCSNCHTFYQKGQKFESKAGRMERFRKMMKKTEEIKQKKVKKK